MANKMTISEKFAKVIELSKANKPLTADLLEFLENEKEKVDRKNTTRKATKNQELNEDIKAEIVDTVPVFEKHTATEIMKMVQPAFPEIEFTNQKISALMKQLVESGEFTKCKEKGVTCFTNTKED